MSLFRSGEPCPPVSLADILTVEDTAEIVAFACAKTGIPIWPQVRVAFFRMIMADLLYSSSDSMDVPLPRDPLRAAATMGRSLLHNARMRMGGLRSSVLINTEAIGDQLQDGKWYNRYVDPFGDLPGEHAMILTDLFEWNWHSPRHNERIYFHAPMQAALSLRSRMVVDRAAREQAEAITAFLCERTDRLIGWRIDEVRRGQFVDRTASKIATCPARYRAYRRLLRLVRPKLLLGSSHCYGFHAPFVAAARDLGIVTAEYQHGAISEGHDAYNFAPAIFASEAYRRTLPDYFLAYGDWWNEHINVPVEKVTVGYPARAKELQAAGTTSTERKEVLILSDGVEFPLYLEVARAVEAAVGPSGFIVVVRPHPMERTAVLTEWEGRTDRIVLDRRTDIYTAFHSAHTVLSEVSTGLFEAVGLVDRVLMLDTPKSRFAYPIHPFTVVDGPEAVVDVVLGRRSGVPEVDPEQLWAPDWHARYNRFLRSKVNLF